MTHLQKFLLTGASVLCLLTQPASAMQATSLTSGETPRSTPVYYASAAASAPVAHAASDTLDSPRRNALIANLVMSKSFVVEDTNEHIRHVIDTLHSGVDPRKVAFICEVLRIQLPSAATSSSAAAASSDTVDRPIGSGIAIPEIARGYEEDYLRFLKMTLIYRPTEGSDVGMIKLPIVALANPLGGQFNLRNCGDTRHRLSIATGYRNGQNPENANKIEIWFAPRFLVDKVIPTLAANHHLRAIAVPGIWDAATAPVGIFWTWGGWNAADHMQHCDYLTTESIEDVGRENLYEKWQKSSVARAMECFRHGDTVDVVRAQKKFHVSFEN